MTRVNSNRDWREFFDLRRTIYADDPCVVFPLRQMERLQLDVDRHPFYEHAVREAWIARRNGEAVGRIVAVQDHMHNEHYSDQTGFFGFFECIDDVSVAQALLNEALKWLKERGCDFVRGPVNPSMKGEFGVLVEGHDVPPSIMMGHTPAYYDSLLQQCGLEVAKEFFTFKFKVEDDFEDIGDKWDRMAEAEEKVMSRFPQLKFRHMTLDNFAATVRDIGTLGNIVRAENYGFVPVTPAELEFSIKQMKRIIRLDMIYAAYWDDQLVGFIVNLPDVNWALRKTVGKADWIRMPQLLYWLKRTPRCRVIMFGVHPEFRKKGIAILLIKKLTDVYNEYENWEFSWVVDDNLKSIRAIGRTMPLKKEKVYRLYEGPIT